MISENEIIQEVQKELIKINMEMGEIIFSNPYKGRISGIAFNNGGEKFFYKYNSNDNANHKELLRKEIEIYRKLEGRTEVLPELYFSSDNMMILKYLEGDRLRDVIIDGRKDEKIIFSKFFQLVEVVRKEMDLELEEVSFRDEFEKIINILIYSKPMKTSVYRIEKLFTGIILKLCSDNFSRMKMKMEEWVIMDEFLKKKSLTHGDFHLNNILLVNDRLYLLDWENCKKSYHWLEVLAAYVQMIFLYHKEDEKWLTDYCYENHYDEDTVKKVKNILLACIRTNRSFGQMTFVEWVKAEFEFVKMLSGF